MLEQERIKRTQIFKPWRVFFWESFLFLLTLGLGIVSALKLFKILEAQQISIPSISFWQFLLYFITATLLILLISFLGKRRLKRGKGTIFKGLFVFIVSWGGLVSLSLWIGDLLALIVIFALVFSWLKRPTILLHNLVMILGMVGMGTILALRLDPSVVVLLLVIFSIYDFIAVYLTKHMVKMAKEMIKAGAIMGLVLPQKISDFTADLKEVKPGGKFLILGGGDVVFPLLLCVSLVPAGILDSLIVAFFAFLGLLFSYLLFIKQKIRKPMPALPPIALFLIIGYLITKLI